MATSIAAYLTYRTTNARYTVFSENETHMFYQAYREAIENMALLSWFPPPVLQDARDVSQLLINPNFVFK